MGTPQRDSFNVIKGYKNILWIKGRDAQDWGLNEMQAQQDIERSRLANRVYKHGAIAEGLLTKVGAPGVIVVSEGKMQFSGRIESVPGATLNYDPDKTSGVDTIYARWLLDQVTAVQDATLVAPATGDVVEERLRTAMSLSATNPDALDEAFENWTGTLPIGWTLNGGATSPSLTMKRIVTPSGSRLSEPVLDHPAEPHRLARASALPAAMSAGVYEIGGAVLKPHMASSTAASTQRWPQHDQHQPLVLGLHWRRFSASAAASAARIDRLRPDDAARRDGDQATA